MTVRSLGTQVAMRHAGPVVVGADAAPTNNSVGIEISSTTRAMLFPRMSTTQRDALSAANGMVIYNVTTDKLQVRAGGTWVNLH